MGKNWLQSMITNLQWHLGVHLVITVWRANTVLLSILWQPVMDNVIIEVIFETVSNLVRERIAFGG